MDHVYGCSNTPPVDTNEENPSIEVPISAPLTIDESMEVDEEEEAVAQWEIVLHRRV